ncbi:MAG TPA: TQO small subunit DoxD [Candidatus Cybelea sp.]|nr:TQO small subunit DoxD [Candidatus Cybelea sp.]
MNLPSSRSYGGWLAVVRFLTGCIWIIHAVPKFIHAADFLPPSGAFGQYVTQGIAKVGPPYHDFLVNVVQPNSLVFADLVRFGELLVGISLVIGLFSRLGGLFGIVLTANYMAARGALSSFSGWASIDGCLMLLSAISLVLPTGRVLGLDAFSARRGARRTVVVPEVVPERPLDGPRAAQ